MLQKCSLEPCYLEAYSQSPLILGNMTGTVCNPPVFEARQAKVIEPVGELKGKGMLNLQKRDLMAHQAPIEQRNVSFPPLDTNPTCTEVMDCCKEFARRSSCQ